SVHLFSRREPTRPEVRTMSAAVRHAPWWLAGVLAAVPIAGYAQITGQFERTFEVDQPLELQVTTGSGSITLDAGDPGSAPVLGRIRARPTWTRSAEESEPLVRALEPDPPIELDGRTLRVGELDDDWSQNLSISYEIRVPAST